MLNTKTIPLVKVLKRNHKVKEATWELKEQIRAQYPHMFYYWGKNFEDKIYVMR